ncbi:MAG: hypothetical protein ACE5FS_13710 [Paracoccaceae bacterium]
MGLTAVLVLALGIPPLAGGAFLLFGSLLVLVLGIRRAARSGKT